ncbi:MAG: ABC transporter substrate-binding protein [Actinomycetota bacterium]|nr:ABC transporter substrate-binding protein [Actinomycetota bacterium]
MQTSATIDRRGFLTGLAVGTAGLALGACGRAAPQGAATAGADTSAVQGKTIRVATFTNSHAASPLYWAQFAPEGLTVETTTLTSGTDMNQALERDQLDFALFGIVNGFVEAEQGLGSRIIAMAARKGAGLVVAADAAFERVEDLRGERIAFKGPSMQSLVLNALLDEAGMDPTNDVELVPVEYNDMPAALQRGDVAAFMGTEVNPSASVASGSGRRLVDPYTTRIGELNSCIWASPRMLDSEPELCRAAVELQRSAAEHLSPGGDNDEDVWRDLIVDQYGLPTDVFTELLTNVGAVWELDERWVSQAKAGGADMAELGILKAEPDYDDLLRTEFMPGQA